MKMGVMKEMLDNSALYGGNAPFIEDLYELYLSNPALVGEEWREYFNRLQKMPGPIAKDVPHSPVLQSFAERAKQPSVPVPATDVDVLVRKQIAVLQLINAYRFRGVQLATVDPLKRQQMPEVPELLPEFYGLTDADLSKVFKSGSLVAPEPSTLHDILQILRETYCGNIGTEYMHIPDTSHKRWIQERLETHRARPQFSPDGKRRILELVTAAETLEKYLHTRYVGQKRFSLEGGDSLIPLLDHLIQRSGSQGVKEMVIGMAHRGRLNVLVNTIGKLPSDLFLEFEGKHAAHSKLASGDVKYHQGFSTDVATPGGPMHLTLAFNPSHLEIVNPVVEGSVRARQQRRHDLAGNQVVPVLIHGDAAFAGQGVVMETLNLSQTRGYGTGGTVHIVINNQIGFTTSDPRDSRSTLYCTDVAKMVGAPIFHVNGDDPEAVLLVTEIALDYRMGFHKDVVIDLVCYRRLGHNEQDEPLVTQPLMYKKIAQHPGTRKLYADRLVAERVLAPHDPEEMIAAYRRDLDAGVSVTRTVLTDFRKAYATDWSPFRKGKWDDPADTSVPLADLQRLAGVLTAIPADFKLHSRVEKVIADRRQMGEGRLPLDWGMAENLAYASLLENGFAVRISGQDSGRGTFFHRHAVLHDQNREKWDAGVYVPLQNISGKQPRFLVIDSVLSEEAVLGFEYGYASAEPNELVIWEAQFGDFANGAQVVIDQFISAGEAKWGRLCGLVMLLPHGYEGQGPEHSSARPERYLQLCAEDNIQVCMPTTPAQIFHLLRRQMVRSYRKPLIVMSPKSLLRHKDAVSSLEDLVRGEFHPVIGEVDVTDPDQVTRVVACSGKVYYDLLAARREQKLNHIAIVRIEQLYPFPAAQFTAEMQRYKKIKELVWAQEEPMNQGAWYQTQHHLRECLLARQQLFYAGRPASASPAVGYAAKHQEQQQALVAAALGKYK
jgi:2-oxoglutarate dehydrogenase E1 component